MVTGKTPVLPLPETEGERRFWRSPSLHIAGDTMQYEAERDEDIACEVWAEIVELHTTVRKAMEVAQTRVR